MGLDEHLARSDARRRPRPRSTRCQCQPLEFALADRMRRALKVSGVSVQDMADYLGVARNTVSTWINGLITPSLQTLRLWAIRTECHSSG